MSKGGLLALSPDARAFRVRLGVYCSNIRPLVSSIAGYASTGALLIISAQVLCTVAIDLIACQSNPIVADNRNNRRTSYGMVVVRVITDSAVDNCGHCSNSATHKI